MAQKKNIKNQNTASMKQKNTSTPKEKISSSLTTDDLAEGDREQVDKSLEHQS